ncbi:hypothetical protein J4427_01560 [Candidatus Woesearchaeota archaeon]|nr:hypothetical protein [Candidatus Woesearchaeota archaeon]
MLLLQTVYSYSDLEANVELKNNNISIEEGIDIRIDVNDRSDRIDVPLLIEYLIEDNDGYISSRDLKTYMLNNNATVFKSIYLFPSLKAGDYKLIVNIDDGNKTITKDVGFSVYHKEESEEGILKSKNINLIIPIFIVIILILIIVMLLVLIHIEKLALERIHKETGPLKAVESGLEKIPKAIKYEHVIGKELKRQKRLLDLARKFRLVSEKTYLKENSRINGRLASHRKV